MPTSINHEHRNTGKMQLQLSLGSCSWRFRLMLPDPLPSPECWEDQMEVIHIKMLQKTYQIIIILNSKLLWGVALSSVFSFINWRKKQMNIKRILLYLVAWGKEMPERFVPIIWVSSYYWYHSEKHWKWVRLYWVKHCPPKSCLPKTWMSSYWK
jgi:hypothetical protein